MTLRVRLAVTTLAAAATAIVALVAVDGNGRRETSAARLIASVQRVLATPGEQARCEASPATWALPPAPPLKMRIRRPGPEPVLDEPHVVPRPPIMDPRLGSVEGVALDGELRAARPTAPHLERGLFDELGKHGSVALPIEPWSTRVAVVVATPWRDGPCAYVYARGSLRDVEEGSMATWVWLVFPLAGVTCAVLLSLGPVVRRIRRLTEAVAASSASGFAGDVAIGGPGGPGGPGGRDEVALLARSFADASLAVRSQMAATEQREAVLREYVANTTHDVAIPLTVLQMHLAAMQTDEPGGAPRDRALLTAAMDEAHYLGALMRNLSAVAKLDAGIWQPAMVVVDLNAIVQRVIARHRPIAQRRDIAIDFAVPDERVVLAGDITLIEQAVSNLVYNAVRHNHAGGHVAVILERTADARFSLRVVDDGPGVPAEELARLVERGFRGTAARTRSPDGLGLGLSIAVRVAELHQLELRFGASEYGGLQVDLEGPLTRS